MQRVQESVRRGSAVRALATLAAAAAGLAAVLAASSPARTVAGPGDLGPHPGHATLSVADLRAHLDVLAGPETEGRDSPSLGLTLAAEYIAERFAEAGLGFAPDSTEAWRRVAGEAPLPEPPASLASQGEGDAEGTFLRPFERPGRAPVPDECRLERTDEAGARSFVYGRDFVPVAGFDGAASGELAFAGFAIDSGKEKYNDLAGLILRDRVVVVLQGEPDHPRRFEGHEISSEGSLWTKLERLEDAGAAAVLVVRRPRGDEPDPDDASDAGATRELGYRYTWAPFMGGRHRQQPRERLPVLEVSPACASALLGEDARELFARYDKRVKPMRVDLDGVTVDLAARTESRDVRIDNVVGWIRGTDPVLADEVVVVGAHYDHLGVDSRGRIGHGADDNASGTAVLIEVGEALAQSAPRRSVAICAFASEEDGLHGSRSIAQSPPVPADRIAAMINLDMIGRGDAREVAVIGVKRNPALERVLKRAQDASKTGVRKLVTGQGEELFQRSDHYTFHEAGVPALFFFEGLPIARNKDYHTWRDTIDLLDFEKIENTARLVFNTAWILANDDERPPAPRD